MVTLVPNLSSWVPLSAYEEFNTEALLTCLRVIDNWQNVFAMLIFCQLVISSFAGKKQILLISYANLHHNSYIHKKGKCCLLDMIECQNSLNLACVEIAWKPNYFQLWIERYVRNFDFIVVLDKIHSCFSQDWNPLRHIDFTATLDLDRHRNMSNVPSSQLWLTGS